MNTPAGPLGQKLEKLDAQLQRLDQQVDELINRIDPILRPQQNNEIHELTSEDKAPTSTYTQRVENINQKLNVICNFLTETTLRVEI